MQLIPAAFRPEPRPRPHMVDAVGEIVVLGAHGGAGTTTLASLLPPAWDMGVIRQPGPGCPSIQTEGRPVVLVARNNASGAGQAMGAVNALAWLRIWVAVLAVVSDGLPEPEAARYRYQLLAPRVGAVMRVPFVAPLRAVENPALAELPRKARQALAEVRVRALRQSVQAVTREQ